MLICWPLSGYNNSYQTCLSILFRVEGDEASMQMYPDAHSTVCYTLNTGYDEGPYTSIERCAEAEGTPCQHYYEGQIFNQGGQSTRLGT